MLKQSAAGSVVCLGMVPLQTLVSLSSPRPEQSFPPLEGVGLVQNLLLVSSPASPRHLEVQGDHTDQALKPPSEKRL